jgi:hypothetical protein
LPLLVVLKTDGFVMIILVLVLVVVVNVVAKDVADNVVVYSAVVVAVAVLACSFSFSDSVDVNVFDLIGMDLVAFVIKSLDFGPDILNQKTKRNKQGQH